MPSPAARPTRTWLSCAAIRLTACPESPGSARRPRLLSWPSSATSRACAGRWSDGDPRLKGAPKTRLLAATAYLDVAPLVVRVALDAPVPDVDLTLPTEVADPVLLSQLAVDFGLTNPINRVLAALGLGA